MTKLKKKLNKFFLNLVAWFHFNDSKSPLNCSQYILLPTRIILNKECKFDLYLDLSMCILNHVNFIRNAYTIYLKYAFEPEVFLFFVCLFFGFICV